MMLGLNAQTSSTLNPSDAVGGGRRVYTTARAATIAATPTALLIRGMLMKTVTRHMFMCNDR